MERLITSGQKLSGRTIDTTQLSTPTPTDMIMSTSLNKNIEISSEEPLDMENTKKKNTTSPLF